MHRFFSGPRFAWAGALLALSWCVAAALACPGAALAQVDEPGAVFTAPGVELLAAGRYGPSPDHDPLALGDASCPPPPHALLEETRHIPAALGQRFGASFRLPGEDGHVVAVTVRLRHPRWREGGQGPWRRVEAWTAWVCQGRESWVGWEFTQGWELAPGPWVLEVVRDADGAEQVVLAVSFVVHERAGAEPLNYQLPGGGDRSTSGE